LSAGSIPALRLRCTRPGCNILHGIEPLPPRE
jgi:hypothetical protein